MSYKETLSTMGKTVLSRVGVTTSKDYEELCKSYFQVKKDNFRLRRYLKALRQRTPHDVIKDEIADVLRNTDGS